MSVRKEVERTPHRSGKAHRDKCPKIAESTVGGERERPLALYGPPAKHRYSIRSTNVVGSVPAPVPIRQHLRPIRGSNSSSMVISMAHRLAMVARQDGHRPHGFKRIAQVLALTLSWSGTRQEKETGVGGIMRLARARVQNYRSIRDSGWFEIEEITCLVGKNEAGKTALLKALNALNPVGNTAPPFKSVTDFPRRESTKYRKDVRDKKRPPANVVTAEFELDSPDDDILAQELEGGGFIKDSKVILQKGYECTTTLVRQTEPPRDDSDNGGRQVRFADVKEHFPIFLYFDEYHLMEGQVNLNALRDRRNNSNLNDSDLPLLGFLGLAGLDLDDLERIDQTEELQASLEAAGNHLTQEVLPYWSQNVHMQVKFELLPGRPGDPKGMQGGHNMIASVTNTLVNVSTRIGTRSRGFVWFFSFLAWYNHIRDNHRNLILLLDEPGLFLHAKAQGDLLRFFSEKVKSDHQLIYTTHSPFMVDPSNFDRVRIVQNRDNERKPRANELETGTRVFDDVMKATSDSLFPLQSALGYEISQSLFVGKNCLVVEGPTDLMYIQAVSQFLEKNGRTGLDEQWTITPVGGADKIPAFVALFRAQGNLNVAMLVDYQTADAQKIQNLKGKLLHKSRIRTYAEFVEKEEADVEDMFSPGFYLELVNGAYQVTVSMDDLKEGGPRIVKQLDKYFTTLPGEVAFRHYRPARYLWDNLSGLEKKLQKTCLSPFEEMFKVLNDMLV